MDKKKTKKKQQQGAHTSCMRKTPYAPNYVNKVEHYFAWAYKTTTGHSACRESVSVWFRSKERPRNDEEWDFRFWLHDKCDKSHFLAWSLTLIPHSLLQKLHRNTCYRLLALKALFFVTSFALRLPVNALNILESVYITSPRL